MADKYSRIYSRVNQRENRARKKEAIALPESASVFNEKMDISKLPTFREAFPTSDALDWEGCENLKAAIILRAAQDYFDVCTAKDRDMTDEEKDQLGSRGYCCKEELERFIDSEWYEALTTIDRNVFRKMIKKHRANGHLPTPYRPRGTELLLNPGREKSEFLKGNGGNGKRVNYI